MNRLPRIVSYSGIGLSLLLLMYSCSVEKGRMQEHLPDASVSRMIVFLIGGLIMLVCLILLGLNDAKQFVGTPTVDLTPVSDEETATPEADLEDAEKVRKTDPLEAVRLMREYLNENPGDAQVMTRIAEIYEKDLRNPLAAALEYEELLKLRLDLESWGRSAIHLTNLYIRLQQQEKAISLLRRIDKECGNTAAGIKARKRLEQIEG